MPAFDRGWLRDDGGQIRTSPTSAIGTASTGRMSSRSCTRRAAASTSSTCWTRRACSRGWALCLRDPLIVDLGCSTGYLLEDLRREHPASELDRDRPGRRGVAQGAPERARRRVLLQADVCALPLEDAECGRGASAPTCSSTCPTIARALAELRRVLRPGARARAGRTGGSVRPTTTTTASSGTSVATPRGARRQGARGGPARCSRTSTSGSVAVSGLLAGQAAQPASLRAPPGRGARGARGADIAGTQRLSCWVTRHAASSAALLRSRDRARRSGSVA